MLDRVTESLLSEFSQQFEIASLPEDVRFEHFAAYITIRRHYSETFDTEDVVTGDGNDTGIDAVAVIVNGHLVTDIDALQEEIDRPGPLDVTFIFVQSERSPSFDGSKMGSFGFGVLDFFKSKPTLPLSCPSWKWRSRCLG